MALFINGVGQDTFSMNGVSIDNLYVDGVLVWTSVPQVATVPRYELTETLVDPSTVDDSANTLDTYNGLLTESDGTTPYEPTALQYPGNGLLELDNGRIMDTQFNPVPNETAMYGIYGADGSTTYNIWAVEHVTIIIYNIYEGDQDTPLTLTFTSSIEIPDESMKITDERPSWLPSLDHTYGPELLYGANNENGGFVSGEWDGVSGNAYAATAYTYNSVSYLNCYTNLANTGHYQAVATEIGETYEINASIVGAADDSIAPTGGPATILCFTDAVPGTDTVGQLASSTALATSPDTLTFDYVATGTTTYVSVKTDTNWTGGSFSTFSMKKRT